MHKIASLPTPSSLENTFLGQVQLSWQSGHTINEQHTCSILRELWVDFLKQPQQQTSISENIQEFNAKSLQLTTSSTETQSQSSKCISHPIRLHNHTQAIWKTNSKQVYNKRASCLSDLCLQNNCQAVTDETGAYNCLSLLATRRSTSATCNQTTKAHGKILDQAQRQGS